MPDWIFRSDATGAARPLARALNAALAFGILVGGVWFAFQQLDYDWNWPAIWKYRQKFLNGWLTTIGLALLSLAASTVLGTLLAFARRSRLLFLEYTARTIVEIVRGTPLLVQVLIAFYVVAAAFRIDDRFFVGIMALAVYHGVFLSEIIRAGIESVGASQWETARAVGFTKLQTYRHVVFPQALRQILPPTAGEFASLVKNSSILSIIAIGELTLNAQEVNANAYRSFESFLPMALGYLVLTLPISLWTQHLETKARYET